MNIIETFKAQILSKPEIAPYADKEFVDAMHLDYYMPTESDKMKIRKSLAREKKSSVLAIAVVLAMIVFFSYFLITDSSQRGTYVLVILFLLVFLVVMGRHFLKCKKAPIGVIKGRAIYLQKTVQHDNSNNEHTRSVNYTVMVWLEDQQKVVLPVTCNQWDFNKIKVGDEVMLAKLYARTIKVFPIIYGE